MYRFDDFSADPETWRLSRDGMEIHVEPLVLQLLIYLIANRERLVTRQELMDTVWGDPVDPRAIDAYARGTMHLDTFTGDGIRPAIEQLETAVAMEPKVALAWGQLAAANAMQGMFGFALPRDSKEMFLAAALQAIEADDQVAISRSGLGWARMYTGDFASACELFEEALRLNPSALYAIHGEADCLLFDRHGRKRRPVARTRDDQPVQRHARYAVAVPPLHGTPF